MSDREILSKAYNNAGREFMAYRLTRVFAKIENNEDMNLHNDVVREIDTMVSVDEESLKAMLKEISDVILRYGMKGIK